ncbi:choice-of-anchor P family protein [Actinophytocola sp.]|uniref:choice-of-anchor P family protein n=1 Tax=Actinophytocola sp. TaxID=1872138 RepID=UPI0025BC4438|nr:choice-of-anchor P family protein [Actinophytocola sp.]
MRNARRTGTVGLAIAGLVLIGVTPAQAADWEAVSAGSLGSANLILDGEPAGIEPIAACDSEDATSGSTSGAEIEDFVEFASGSTTCTRDESNGVATARVIGGRFRLDGLRSYGGPRIRMTSYSATCNTTATGSQASFQFTGLTGVEVPSNMPPNHKVTIPGRRPHAKPLATIVFNEKIVPSPPDGSMTVNLMHIKLFPKGPATRPSGDIVVGSVSCAPF